MPSLRDIPDHLLDASKKDEFLRWLLSYPIPWDATRALARLWLNQTGTILTADQWTYLELAHRGRYGR